MPLFFKKNSDISEVRSSPACINKNKNISERVIDELLKTSELLPEDIAIDARTLQHRYGLAEQIGIQQITLDDKEAAVFLSHFPHCSIPQYHTEEDKAAFHMPLEDIDYVVSLSGRSGFYGQYQEAKDKVQLCQNNYDATDTMRRLLHAIKVAKQATLNNFRKGIFKITPVYFNGVTLQNEQLKEIIRSQDSLNQYIKENGYSEDYFYPIESIIIDDIPLDNTMGQVIGLSYYLHHHWSMEEKNRYPNIIYVSNTYHVPRIEGGMGNESPLHTAEFFKQRPEVLGKLPASMRSYVLSPRDILKNARIMVLGCDRQYTAVAAWEKDLYGDMQANVNYASLHRKNASQPVIPSIAARPSPNIVTHFHAAVQQSLANEQFFEMIRQRQVSRALNFLYSRTPENKEECQPVSNDSRMRYSNNRLIA